MNPLIHPGLRFGLIAVALLGLAAGGCAHFTNRNAPAENAPNTVAGVRTPVISLNGDWQCLIEPPENFWAVTNHVEGWQPIAVPGEPQMQGFAVSNDQEFAYQTRIHIPDDFSGHRVFVHFEGVCGEARVWINGHFLRSHLGSFTPWECELTPWVEPGGEALLTVGVTDRTDDISAATAYAKHCIGGILRGVALLARPPTYLDNLQVQTRLTNDHRAAMLLIQARMIFAGNSEATLRFSLRDPAGHEVALPKSALTIKGGAPAGVAGFPVSRPQLWDAEHPRLYTLTTRCFVAGKEVSSRAQPVGFREITWGGGKLRVNGRVVKLRGVCRHDMHPLLGRVSTPEYELKDAELCREANINFIRTSHYPPTENFLRLCDKSGIFVECESAVCFNGTWVDSPYKEKLRRATDDPAFTPWYLGQAREMVESFRNHPSIIIWSEGDECRYGRNIGKELDLIRELDGTRPVISSYSKTAGDLGAPDLLDLCSIHYPSVEGVARPSWMEEGMNHWHTDGGRPSLGDEWAHVPCYCPETLRIDPGVDDFWGESISRMWTSCFNSENGVGGAIWGFVDETFQLPQGVAGYGPWGIVDVWRRKKPEFWNTEMAYSPVYLAARELNCPASGSRPTLPVQNRHDFTDFSELTVRWWYDGRTGSFTPAALPPHACGMLTLPALPWRDCTTLRLDFLEPDGRVAYTCRLAVTGARTACPPPNINSQPVRMVETATNVLVAGADFSVSFDKSTGLMASAQRLGKTILTGGPRLNVSATDDPKTQSRAVFAESLNEPFVLESFTHTNGPDSVRVTSKGRVGARTVTYTTSIAGNGRLRVAFQVRQPKQLFGQECGLAFALAPGFTDIAWQRQTGLWTSYPPDDLGRLEGRAPLFAPELATRYRQPPACAWAQDASDFFLYGIADPPASALTRDAKSSRPDLRRYTVSGKDMQVAVCGTGWEAARIRRLNSGELALVVNTDWDYLNLDWGDYIRGLVLPNEFSGQVTLDLGR